MIGRATRWPAPAPVLALLGLSLVLATPGMAASHAIVLESSLPHDAVLTQVPARVMLRFNGRIEQGLSRATLTSEGRPPMPLPIVRDAPEAQRAIDRLVLSLPSLSPGSYVIRYRVLAADGHITEGALGFTVRATP